MNVSRLMSLATEEEKSEAADAENFWHVRLILATRYPLRQDFEFAADPFDRLRAGLRRRLRQYAAFNSFCIRKSRDGG